MGTFFLFFKGSLASRPFVTPAAFNAQAYGSNHGWTIKQATAVLRVALRYCVACIQVYLHRAGNPVDRSVCFRRHRGLTILGMDDVRLVAGRNNHRRAIARANEMGDLVDPRGMIY